VSDIAFQREFSPASGLANYRLVGLVGQGQFAQVYCAMHRRTGQLAAIKQTRHLPEQASQEPFVLHELNHPNVTNCQAIFQTSGGYQFVLDYCEAGTLRSHLTPPHPCSLSTTQALIGDILRGLGHIHQRQIIHGDLKPENILLTYSAQRLTAKIGDFGSARFVELPARTRREIGSPTYAAPERFDGQSSYASDLYSVGVMLYELLLGDRPFSGSPDALRRAHQSQPVAFPARLADAIKQLLTTALHKQPNQRFATAEAMLSALQQLSEGQAAANLLANSPREPSVARSVTPSVTPEPIALADISDPIENLISLPQGCCLVTAHALHLLTPQRELMTLAQFDRACWFALSPNGSWYIALPKAAPRQSKGEFCWLGRTAAARPLRLSGPLLTSLRSDVVQLLAIDNRYLLRVRTAFDRPNTTYFECFTRHGQFVTQLTLPLTITQIALTAVPYQLIAISKFTDSPAKVVLIMLKPFQIKTLQLLINPEKVSGLPWGYLITAKPNALLLDRLANPIGSLTGLPAVAAIAPFQGHRSKILLASPTTHLDPQTGNPLRGGAESSLFEIDLESFDLGIVF
jgi:serine/threonine-protein kinase